MSRSTDVVILSGEEYDELILDKDRLDQLEVEVRNSYTGLTITRVKGSDAEDGVSGYRIARFHKIFDVKPTLREAIDEAFFK